MIRMNIAVAAIVAVGWAASEGAAAVAPSTRATYRNSEYGFAFSYPAAVLQPLQGGAADRISDPKVQRFGQAFASRDRRAFLVAAAAMNTSRGGARAYRDRAVASNYAKARITYDRVESDWFVLSGYKGRDIFYERMMFSCGGRVVNAWSLTYPAAERAIYDPIIEELVATFRPGEGPGRCP